MGISAKQLGLEVLGTSAGEELVKCPFHSDRSPSAWYSPKKELFYCSVCGFGMNLQQLSEKLNIDLELDDLGTRELPDFDLLTETPYIPRGGCIYVDYFEQRGISELTAHYYALEWREEEPAAVITYRNLQGNVIGSMLRYTDPAKAGTRYRIFGDTTPIWPMETLNFKKADEEIIVVEGAWSAMKISQYYAEQGIFNVPVALLGAKANQSIVDCLKPFKPIFLYDGDQAGKNACLKMKKLSPTVPAFVLKTSPDDMEMDEIGSLMERIRERVDA